VTSSFDFNLDSDSEELPSSNTVTSSTFFEGEDALSSSFEDEESEDLAGTPQARVATANRIVNFPHIILSHN